MQSRNPGHVTINNRRVKAQRWQQTSDHIKITMLVHGYQSGLDLLELLGGESISLQWDDSDAISASPEISNHQVTGDGPATVHRIEATFWLPPVSEMHTASLEARLLRVEEELKQVQAELNELRQHRGMSTRPQGQSQPLRQGLDIGKTLIETDIDIDE